MSHPVAHAVPVGPPIRPASEHRSAIFVSSLDTVSHRPGRYDALRCIVWASNRQRSHERHLRLVSDLATGVGARRESEHPGPRSGDRSRMCLSHSRVSPPNADQDLEDRHHVPALGQIRGGASRRYPKGHLSPLRGEPSGSGCREEPGCECRKLILWMPRTGTVALSATPRRQGGIRTRAQAGRGCRDEAPPSHSPSPPAQLRVLWVPVPLRCRECHP